MADRVGVDGVVGAGEHEQSVRCRRQVQLERGCVDLARPSELRQRVLRRQRQREPEIAELHVEIDGDDAAGVTLGEGDREVGRHSGLAGAALR